MEAALIEIYELRRTWMRWLVRPLVTLLCRLAAMEVEFVPLGLGGDRVPAWFHCKGCRRGWYASVSMANEEVVECPECGAKYLTANDCSRAWIVHPVGQT